MLEKNLDTITYSNYFTVGDQTFAFRKKHLFNITNIPKYVELKDNNNCLGYWLNRKWFSLSKIKNILIHEPKIVDISDIQWYLQINLEEVIL